MEDAPRGRNSKSDTRRPSSPAKYPTKPVAVCLHEKLGETEHTLTRRWPTAAFACDYLPLLCEFLSLAREVASRGITVNVVAPGFIDTDMTQALSAAQHETLLAQIPLGRLGRPEDIGAAVAFLASPAASYITGETLHINGGMYMS